MRGNTVIVQPTRSNRVQINHLASTGREALTADIGGAVVPPEYADLLRRIKEKENRVVEVQHFLRTELPGAMHNTAGKRRRGREPKRSRPLDVLPMIYESSVVRGVESGRGDESQLDGYRGNTLENPKDRQQETNIDSWPTSLKWSIFHSCHMNEALCLYATICPWCIFAETMAKTGRGSFYTHLCITQTLFCGLPSFFIKNIVNFLPLGLCLSSLFNPTPCISMNTRIILARNHGLSTDECWSPCCAHYWCGPCATYQEALFVEQVYGPFEGPCCLSSLSFGAPFDNSEIDRSWAQRSALEKLREADATNSKFDGRLFGTGLGIDNTEEPLSLWVDDDKAYFTG